MIRFDNGGVLIQPGDPMPTIPPGIKELFLDFETTSRDKKTKSVNVWHSCFPLGVAITWDDHPFAYYLPIEHAEGFEGTGNIDGAFVKGWLQHVFDLVAQNKGAWYNHNVKYDFHVAQNWGIEITCPIVCTLTTAKIIDSDRQYRGGYGLDVLSLEWCGNDIGQFEAAMYPYLAGAKNQDYGRVPVDLMAEYACTDVLANRPVWRYIDENIPPESREVFEMEIAQTRVIADMEAVGMKVDPAELGVYGIMLNEDLIDLWEKIKAVVGYDMNPASTKDCYTLLCQQHGLPVLKYTNEDNEEKESNPSFGKDVLEKYKAFSITNELRQVLNWILEYRKKDKLLSGFIKPYINLHTDGIIHPSYNQAVRTGRMSCSKPNMQQLNKAAKALFKPRPGNSLLLIDYSQIEFRLIVHFINDENAIAAYRANPRTDFHAWMAEVCGIPRQAAKRMNFLIGYGGGKAKTKAALQEVDEIIAMAQARVQEQIQAGHIQEHQAGVAYSLIVEEIATMAYNTYHAKLPNLKRTSKRVEAVGRSRIDWSSKIPMGYIINLYGRPRHTPADRCHILFNSVCQSGAADLIKERTLALARAIADTGLHIVLQVHDSLGIEGPTELLRDPRTINDITWIMENPPILEKLRVPIKTNAGISEISWADADLEYKVDGKTVKPNDCTVEPVPPAGGVPFSHLTRTACVGYTQHVA